MDDDELISALSKLGGESAAISAIVLAICRSLPNSDPMANEIAGHLENSYAHHLQVTMNPAFFAGFEQMMELAKLALKAPING